MKEKNKNNEESENLQKENDKLKSEINKIDIKFYICKKNIFYKIFFNSSIKKHNLK